MSCTYTGTLPPGDFGTFDLTVHIDPGATGTVVAGNYNIDSDTTSPLLGSKVTTVIAECLVDANCAANQWCHPQSFTCTPDLPNGTLIPNLAGHAPPLTGTCTAPAAAAVCIATVCDVGDDQCGYANGNGPCDQVNGATVCRSAVCDPDGNCGYANGNGPCTLANQGTVCRSGSCSPNGGVCIPPEGCAVDADCGSSQWCNTETFSCTPKLPNGQPIPTVDDHAPPLTGTCSEPVAVAVCLAGVCDTGDDLCSLSGSSQVECGKCCSNEDCADHPSGPFCDTGSGACGTLCHADSDCDVDQWCNAPAGGGGMCVPKLDNGTKLPGSPPEVVTCTAEVGARVCVSGVCDATNDTCGYLNGNGPCEDGTVCQSGACDGEDDTCGYLPGNGPCDADGVCRTTTCDVAKGLCAEIEAGCMVDADCPDGNFCSEGACIMKLPNGETCSGSNQCQSDNCGDGVCSERDAVVAEGSGLFCSFRSSTPRDDTPAGVLGLMLLAGAGLVRRRRRG